MKKNGVFIFVISHIVPEIFKIFVLCKLGTDNVIRQEPITRSVQLPYSVCETAFSQVGLFLDKPFPRNRFQKPIRSECIINNKLLMRN